MRIKSNLSLIRAEQRHCGKTCRKPAFTVQHFTMSISTHAALPLWTKFPRQSGAACQPVSCCQEHKSQGTNSKEVQPTNEHRLLKRLLRFSPQGFHRGMSFNRETHRFANQKTATRVNEFRSVAFIDQHLLLTDPMYLPAPAATLVSLPSSFKDRPVNAYQPHSAQSPNFSPRLTERWNSRFIDLVAITSDGTVREVLRLVLTGRIVLSMPCRVLARGRGADYSPFVPLRCFRFLFLFLFDLGMQLFVWLTVSVVRGTLNDTLDREEASVRWLTQRIGGKRKILMCGDKISYKKQIFSNIKQTLQFPPSYRSWSHRLISRVQEKW